MESLKFGGGNTNFDIIYETRNIKANIVIDQSYCYQWINNFKVIFNELGRIQGDEKILY